MDPRALGLTRAFVAVDLPEGHREALAAHLEECRRAAPEFRWAPAPNLHLTVRFCGQVEEATLPALRAGLREIRRAPFELALGERGTFGGGRHVRVVWLGVTAGAAPLGELAAAVETGCRAAGLPPEERPFKAHLTLARAGGRTGGAALPELPPPPALPPWEVAEFVLYESRLGRGPAVYAPIERFGLSR